MIKNGEGGTSLRVRERSASSELLGDVGKKWSAGGDAGDRSIRSSVTADVLVLSTGMLACSMLSVTVSGVLELRMRTCASLLGVVEE